MRGRKTGGRRKGAQNKLTSVARDAIAQAAASLGGAKRLVAWAREKPENETAFWTRIYPRLLPVQVVGTDDRPIQVIITETDARL